MISLRFGGPSMHFLRLLLENSKAGLNPVFLRFFCLQPLVRTVFPSYVSLHFSCTSSGFFFRRHGVRRGLSTMSFFRFVFVAIADSSVSGIFKKNIFLRKERTIYFCARPLPLKKNSAAISISSERHQDWQGFFVVVKHQKLFSGI